MEHFECDRCKRGSKKNKSSLNEGEEMSDENSRDFVSYKCLMSYFYLVFFLNLYVFILIGLWCTK